MATVKTTSIFGHITVVFFSGSTLIIQYHAYGLIFHLLLQHTVIRARSFLVPADSLAEFLSELLIESDVDDRVDHGVRVA